VLAGEVAHGIDGERGTLSGFEPAIADMADVHDGIADLRRLLDVERARGRDDAALITDLPALLGVEAGSLEQEADRLVLIDAAGLHELIVIDPAKDAAFGGEAEPLRAVVGFGYVGAYDGSRDF